MVQKFIGTGNNLINTHIFNEASTEYKFLNSLDINDRTAVYWPNEGINKKFPYKANSLPFPQPHKFYPLLGNFQLPFLVPSYSTYVSIILTNLAEFHKNISTNNETLPFPSKLDSQIYLYDINNDLVDYSAIKYIFSPIKINNIKYRLIKTGDYYYIYENTRAHEKIDFIRDTLVTRMNKRIYYDISNIYSDLNSGEYTINKIIYSYNNISFEIDSLKDGYAVIKDTYAKWWDVKINGISSSIFVVNDIFRGIHILKGNNKVVLKYSPRYFYYGIIMFSLGIVLIIFIINFNILRINSKNK